MVGEDILGVGNISPNVSVDQHGDKGLEDQAKDDGRAIGQLPNLVHTRAHRLVEEEVPLVEAVPILTSHRVSICHFLPSLLNVRFIQILV